jgi:hypothetical protein
MQPIIKCFDKRKLKAPPPNKERRELRKETTKKMEDPRAWQNWTAPKVEQLAVPVIDVVPTALSTKSR